MKLSALCLSAFIMMFAAVNTAVAQTGDEIIDKHITAIGGGENWNKVTSLKLIGSVNVQGMDVPFSRTCMDRKGMRMDFSPMGIDCYFIISDVGGWMYMPMQPGMDKVTPMPEEALTKTAAMLNIKHTLLADKEEIAEAKYLGTETLNGKSCLKLDIVDIYENKLVAFFDAKTYYLLRTEVKAEDGEDETGDRSVNYSNFQEQPEGVVIPMTESNPMLGGDVTFKTVEVNKPILSDIFKPTEPKK